MAVHDNSRNPWLLPVSIVTTIVVTAAVTLVGYHTARGYLDKQAGDKKADKKKTDDHGRVHPHGDEYHIELTETAVKNIGLERMIIKRRPFPATLSVPAMIVERPGRCNVTVAAPLEGIVTDVHFLAGEAVKPGKAMFELRLTHEELMQGQAEYLRTLVALDVVKREITRLAKLSDIAGGELRERRYDREKYEEDLKAQRQGLILHGIPDERIAKEIDKKRALIQTLTVYAPEGHRVTPDGEETHLYQLEKLKVVPGQHVKTGAELGVLADHAELFIRGKAFERDADALSTAAAKGWDVTAVFPSGGKQLEEISGLKILYVDSEIDEESRALPFFVTLPNKLMPGAKTGDKRQFISWKYKPGQRLELRVTVGEDKPRIVVPSEAVVGEGLERFIFVGSSTHFTRREVHVEYQDWRYAVLAEDEKLREGLTRVVTTGAYLLQQEVRQFQQGGSGGGHGHSHAGHSHP